MKLLSLILILSFGVHQALIAGNNRDSLLMEARSQTNDEAKINALLNLSDYYIDFDKDSSLIFSKLALQQALKCNYREGQSLSYHSIGKVLFYERYYDKARDYYRKELELLADDSTDLQLINANYMMGNSFFHNGMYDSAQVYYGKALDFAVRFRDTSKIISNCLSMGVNYKVQGDYINGMNNFLKALRYAEQSNDTLNISVIYNSIGLIYKNQRLYNRALSYFFESLKLIKGLNNSYVQSKVQGNIGVVYRRMGQYDKALDHLNQSLVIAKKIDNKDFMSSAYTNIANVYKARGDYKKAIDNYNKSVEIKKEIGDQEGLAIVYQGLGSLYLVSSKSSSLDPKKQKSYLQRSISFSMKSFLLSKKLNILPVLKEASKTLMTAYGEMGDFGKAYMYSKIYIEVKDSLISSEKLNILNELEKKYANEKNEILIEKLESEKELGIEKAKRQELDLLIDKRQKYVLILGIVLLVVITLIITYNLYKRKELNRALILKNRKIEESEIKFRTITEAANDAIILADNNEEIVLWNNAAEKIFGYSEDEVLHKNLHDILPDYKYRDAAHNAFAIFKDTGKGDAINKTLELDGLRKNGEVFSVELSLSAININGVWNAVGIIRDVSERKKHNLELEVINVDYKKILNANSDVIFIINSGGDVLYINNRINMLLGYNYDEIIGRSFTKFVPDGHVEGYLDKIMNVFECAESFESYLKHKEGMHIPVEIAGSIIQYQGQTVGVGTIRDITDRKIAEQEIIDRTNKYELLTLALDDFIWMVDFNMKFIYLSPSCKKHTGYDEEELQKIGITNLYTEPSLDVLRKIIAKAHAASSVNNRVSANLDCVRKSGVVHEAHVIGHIVFDKDDNPMGFGAVSRFVRHKTQS